MQPCELDAEPLPLGGDVVLSYRRSFMVYKRAAGEDALRFPEAREDWPEA